MTQKSKDTIKEVIVVLVATLLGVLFTEIIFRLG